MDIGTKIMASMGEKKADILFTNARIVDVFSGEIIPGDIAVAGGFIAGFVFTFLFKGSAAPRLTG